MYLLSKVSGKSSRVVVIACDGPLFEPEPTLSSTSVAAWLLDFTTLSAVCRLLCSLLAVLGCPLPPSLVDSLVGAGHGLGRLLSRRAATKQALLILSCLGPRRGNIVPASRENEHALEKSRVHAKKIEGESEGVGGRML
jgi:hypothetical protein